MTKTIGVILAGGIGSRLGGVCKPNLKIGGVRLIDRVYDAMSMQCEIVLVAGSIPNLTINQSAQKWISVPDASGPGAGPVSGVAGAIKWLQDNNQKTELLLSVAADTAFLPDDYLRRLKESYSDDIDIAAATDGTNIYPTNALWRTSALKHLPFSVEAGESTHGLRNIHPENRTAMVKFSPKELLNINSMRDVLVCQAHCLDQR